MATLTAYILRMKHGIYISGQVRCKLQGVSYIVSKWRHELWSTNGFKLEVSFDPLSVNSAFHFIARLRRRRSANETLPNFAKRWTVGIANNMQYRNWGRSSLKNGSQKAFIHLFGFSTISRLNGEYLLNETWHRQLGKGFGKYEASPTLSQSFVNFGPQTP